LQSNAQEAEGRSDATARVERSVIRDLEGAMAADVMGGTGRGDGEVRFE